MRKFRRFSDETIALFPPGRAGHPSFTTEAVASMTDVSLCSPTKRKHADLSNFGFLTPEQRLSSCGRGAPKAGERKHQKKTSEKEKIEKLKKKSLFWRNKISPAQHNYPRTNYNELNTIERPVKTAEAPCRFPGKSAETVCCGKLSPNTSSFYPKNGVADTK